MTENHFDMTNQVAVITGGGRGIGRAVALRFAAAGADIAIVDRDEIAGRGVVEEVTGLGQRLHLAAPLELSIGNVVRRILFIVSKHGFRQVGVEPSPHEWCKA